MKDTIIVSGLKGGEVIEGKGKKQVGINDIVSVQEGTPHQITCVGDSPGIRFAITAPDVNHVYLENEDK